MVVAGSRRDGKGLAGALTDRYRARGRYRAMGTGAGSDGVGGSGTRAKITVRTATSARSKNNANAVNRLWFPLHCTEWKYSMRRSFSANPCMTGLR